MSDDLVERLRQSWDTDRSIMSQTSRWMTERKEAADRIEELEASKNEALNQLDSALHSVSVLEKRVKSLIDENSDLKAKLAKEIRISNERGNYIEFTLTPQLADAEAQNEALKAQLAKAVEAGVDVAASLNAAISLLERGGKKAAPSDKMFAQMLVDYSASLDRFRTTLKELTGGKDE